MFNFEDATRVLIRNGIPPLVAAGIAEQLQQRQVRLGVEMYCVTQRDSSLPWEVVPARVTRTHITRRQTKVFAVAGKYAPYGEFGWVYEYKANFYDTSIGKTVFFTAEEAQVACDKKNNLH